MSQTNPRPDLPASPLNLKMCQNDPQGHVTGCWGPQPLPVQLTPSPETTDCVKATLPCIYNTCPLNFESGKGQLHTYEPAASLCVSPLSLPVSSLGECIQKAFFAEPTRYVVFPGRRVYHRGFPWMERTPVAFFPGPRLVRRKGQAAPCATHSESLRFYKI